MAVTATATARGLLSPATAMAATDTAAMAATAMAAMAVTATATARGLPSPATAMAATVTATAMATDTATSTTVERRPHLQSPYICDHLRVLNYVRNKKMYCS